MDLAGKHIAVLGAGTSGFSAAQLACARGAEKVTVFDSGQVEKLESRRGIFRSIGVDCIFGDEALMPPRGIDLTVISPGIDAGWPIGRVFQETEASLIGEIEFAWQCAPGTPVIAITGTNGKTTTTELTATILNGAGVSSVAVGNVGTAYSEVIAAGKEYDVFTVEVSSFQLETIDTFQPTVSVWMNFAPDHMDRYSSIEDYRNAKLRVFENQGSGDLAVIKFEESIATKSRQLSFSGFSGEGDFHLEHGKIYHDNQEILNFRDTRLNGKHNAENVMAAMAAAHEFGVEFSEMGDAIRGFQAPPHRCEVVGDVNGVTFVNDSKATNLHALESALRGQEEPVVLIVGGKNKGLDYSEISQIVSVATTQVICIGEIRESIFEQWKDIASCHIEESLESAVETAAREAAKGQVVLFSPGTSSFDMFSSYGERGDAFRDAVKNLV